MAQCQKLIETMAIGQANSSTPENRSETVRKRKDLEQTLQADDA